MFKLEIFPSFLNESTLELKPNGPAWELLLCKHSNPDLNDQGAYWHASPINHPAVNAILKLAQESFHYQPTGNRVIADGIAMRLLLKEDEVEQDIELLNPSEDSAPHQMMKACIQLIRDCIDDPACRDYMTRLEEYV